jgi:hypothetical protein
MTMSLIPSIFDYAISLVTALLHVNMLIEGVIQARADKDQRGLIEF